MTDSWISKETTTHQDHVIAHVLGATVLGYLVFDEALHVLLDIGFVWTIFLDGEMALVPHPVAIGQLEMGEQDKNEIKADIDLLLSDNWSAEQLSRMSPAPIHSTAKQCEISEVNFVEQDDRRRLLLTCEGATLAIETSLTTAEIKVMTLSNNEPENEKAESPALREVAQTEHEYVHERLRQELGREPTEEELDEWLRRHTEGY